MNTRMARAIILCSVMFTAQQGLADVGGYIRVLGGTLNGYPLSPADPEFTVQAGFPISGSFTIGVQNNHPPSAVEPLAATPTWGNPSTSYWGIRSSVPSGYSTYTVNVNLNAAPTPGTYYIATAKTGCYNYAQLMSGTHAAYAADWVNGNVLAERPSTDFELAIEDGTILYDWYTPSGWAHGDMELAAIRVVTTPEPATLSLLALGGLALMRRRAGAA